MTVRAIVSEETTGDVGVNSNVEIERYAVEAVGITLPSSDEDALWDVQTDGRFGHVFQPD